MTVRFGTFEHQPVTEERYMAGRTARLNPANLQPGKVYMFRQRMPKPWGVFALESLVGFIKTTPAEGGGFAVHLGIYDVDGELIYGGGGPGHNFDEEGVAHADLAPDEEYGYLVDGPDELDVALQGLGSLTRTINNSNQ